MVAVRNIQLCTKDCLCLYVCPTGATDTETGQIDPEKCLEGCRACVDACPSHAISLIPKSYPPQQDKNDAVVKGLYALAESKMQQSKMASMVANDSEDIIESELMSAVSISNELMAEDLLREAGYMLPQSEHVQKILETLLIEVTDSQFPRETVKELLGLLKANNN